jgi:hypothetical protein
MPAGDFQQLPDLMHFVRLNLLLRQRRGFGEECGVAEEMAAAYGLIQCVAGGPVDVVGSSGR